MTWMLELRRQLAWQRRRRRDRGLDLMAPGVERCSHPARLELEQPLGADAGAKRHNIQLAANALAGRPLRPGQIFSFWHLVGRPLPARGFMAGRSLLAGELVRDPGGGLCQLAGALYHLALLGGLEVVERWPHSVDLYREDERYTPLGADASIAWALRDLRLRSQVELSFDVAIGPDHLRAALCSPHPLPRCDLRFARIEDGPTHRSVLCLRERDGTTERIALSSYRIAASHGPSGNAQG